MKKIWILFCFVFLTGCNNCSAPTRFELICSTDGRVYRLDKKTGEVSLVTPEGMKTIPDANNAERKARLIQELNEASTGATNAYSNARDIKLGDTIDGKKIINIKKIKEGKPTDEERKELRMKYGY